MNSNKAKKKKIKLNTNPIKTFCLENVSIDSVQFSPSSGSSAIYASYLTQDKDNKKKIFN